jgi:hypothetical protein
VDARDRVTGEDGSDAEAAAALDAEAGLAIDLGLRGAGIGVECASLVLEFPSCDAATVVSGVCIAADGSGMPPSVIAGTAGAMCSKVDGAGVARFVGSSVETDILDRVVVGLFLLYK